MFRYFQSDLMEVKLSSRSVDEVCELVTRTSEISAEAAARYIALIRANNITGKVLLHCDLNELKNVSNHPFYC